MSEKYERPVVSALDTDQYKLTMHQAFLHRAPGADAEYKFVNRTAGADLARFSEEINDELSTFCANTRFTAEELEWLSGLRYMKRDYVDRLEDFTFKRKYLTVEPSRSEPGALEITAAGPLTQVMLFEIPVLSTVNEVFFRNTAAGLDTAEGERRLSEKIEKARAGDPGFVFADFGTRRRFSRAWQERVVTRMKSALPGIFVGTSNMDLARRHGLTPIGTMAHEFLQAFQALGPRLGDSQKAALDAWVGEYRGDLGIALTDVAGVAAFLRDFDLFFAKLFDGVRHDSGDPFEWGGKMLRHYKKLGVDSRTKTFVFSDGLDMDKAVALHHRFKDSAKISCGIGTNLTNDLGPKALNIVMKMVSCNGHPVAKISDEPGKTICRDGEFLSYFKKVFKIGEAWAPEEEV